MGITNIEVTITNIENRKKKASGEFMVDTGAGYTVIPYTMSKQLDLKPTKNQKFSLADGSIVRRNLSYAMVEFEGNKAPSTVILWEKGDSALLGAVTLEALGLMLDPLRREIRPLPMVLGGMRK